MHVTTPWSFEPSSEEHLNSLSKGHEQVHSSELRRRSALPKDDDDDSNDEPEIHLVDGPLFSKYQFLTPGMILPTLLHS